MKFKFLAAVAGLFCSQLAFAADELKAVACLYELQAETYRFARLQMEIGASTNPALAGKLRAQIKAATQGLVLIGSTKVSVERLACDFEFCDKNGAQQLPPEMAEIEKSMESMRSSQGKYFNQGNHELAKSQLVFLRMVVDSRAKGAPVTDAAQSNVIVTATHLWEVIDKVLDGYIDKAGV